MAIGVICCILWTTAGVADDNSLSKVSLVLMPGRKLGSIEDGV